MRIIGYGLSGIGSRKQNQDAFLVNNERALFAVADGVGGGERGDVAALMAVTGISEHPEEGSSLKDTVETIQTAILTESTQSLGDARMGTTLTVAQVVDGVAHICHVGDSRCYRYRDGLLEQLTTDHENFDETYGGPVLNSYLGIPTDVFPLVIQQESLELQAGDRLLLCSDGLYKQVSENDLVDTIKRHFTDPGQLIRVLLELATQGPHSDNVTMVYIEVHSD